MIERIGSLSWFGRLPGPCFLPLLLGLMLFACHTASTDDIPRLVKALKHSDSSVRNQAAMELASLGEDGKSAVPALAQALSDPNGGVRSSVAFALRKIDTPEARRALDNYKK